MINAMHKSMILAGFLASAAALPLAAEQSVSIYGGLQETSSSSVDVQDIDGARYSFDADWEGRSFEMPPYYGIRYTNWAYGDMGFAIDFAHSKAYSTDATRAATGYDVMEFTDGVNVLSINAMKRFSNDTKWTPYIGAGLGVSLPHVELKTPLTAEKTFGYQFGGWTATALLGTSYQLNNTWSVFAETKVDYVNLDVDIDGGGSYETDFVTSAVNLGLSYSF